MKMKQTVRASLIMVTGLAMLATAETAKKSAAPSAKSVDSSVKNTFYVYADKGAKVNHFIPSGWMGDYGDIKVDDSNTTDPADGKSCIKISYSGKATQGANWAGVFWQNPANNWGDKPGGYDLSAFKRITFWARVRKAARKSRSSKSVVLPANTAIRIPPASARWPSPRIGRNTRLTWQTRTCRTLWAVSAGRPAGMTTRTGL